MGKRGEGYGSEDHFLRYRTARQEEFDGILLKALGAPQGRLEWLYPSGAGGEREPQGISFIDDAGVKDRWREFWPRLGRAQTWDGIGKLHGAGHGFDWVLIEAKANAQAGGTIAFPIYLS